MKKKCSEISTTKYDIKSQLYTRSTDTIPSVSTEFGEYQKTITEIGQDSVTNPLNGDYKWTWSFYNFLFTWK